MKYYTHTELVEQYRAGLITLDEYFKAIHYSSDLVPVKL